jgi:hypothetical protein
MFSTGDGTFSTDLAAVAFALGLLLLPVALGLLIAAALRALLPSRRAQLLWAPPLVLSPVALSLVAIPHTNALSFWDVLIAGLGVAAGLTLGMLQPAGRVASSGLRAGGRVLVGLLIAEVIVRVALPSAGSVPPPRSARLMVPVTNRDPPCNVMFPTEAELRERSTSGAPGRPTVLHIGDSLVAGIGVSASENFVADLNAAQPSVRHLNLGSVGAGPDVYLLALSRWAPAAHPRLAVVYVFAGNDLFDLNAHYLCCPQGLLRDEGARLTPRCPTARWNIPLRAHLANSPAPFVLRALAGVSRIAGHLLTFVARVQQDVFRRGFGMVPSPNDPASQVPRWGLFARTIRAIAATAAEQHTPLLVVVLPSRTTLERSLGLPALANDYWVDRARGEAGHRRIVATAREAGLDVLDAWDFVREAMGRDGVEALFAREYPGDVHFSPLGHRRLTDWLLPALRARGVTP